LAQLFKLRQFFCALIIHHKIKKNKKCEKLFFWRAKQLLFSRSIIGRAPPPPHNPSQLRSRFTLQACLP
jgi:hypothetical protein